MKLLTFSLADDPTPRLGMVKNGFVIDVPRAFSATFHGKSPDWFSSASSLLQGDGKAMDLLSELERGTSRELRKESDHQGFVFSSDKIVFHPIISGAPKIFCVAVNYAAHAVASSTVTLDEPYVFIKFPNNLIGNNSPILLSKSSKKCDSEIELGVVIGKKGKYISRDKAMEYVAGYTVFNDVSYRDRRLNKSDPTRTNWLHLKNLDSAAPAGPWIATKDEVPDPYKLTIKLELLDRNGGVQEIQGGSTSDMTHDISEIIEYISNGVTLSPGDIIATGTPHKIAFGKDRYLKEGDIVRADIQNVGTLVNPVQSESI
ncbi:MAG: fumarylacetoacetate hydrolase family protein [Thaumarchaeota archaeon]|nr:fumarylacetoacetate hydrolase family protein [Nitrososphaerota archaeon]